MIDFPLWFTVLILGVAYWPVTLAAFLLAGAGAVATRGAARVVLAAMAVVFLIELGAAAWWGVQAAANDRKAAAFEARIHQVLEQPMTVDGLDLPAGTEVQWSDESRTHLHSVNFSDPTPVFGIRFTFLAASDGGEGWTGRVEEPQPVDGWTCSEDGNVLITAQGRFRSCRLARARDWNGWRFPAASLVDVMSGDGLLGVVLPGGPPLPAPEIGRALPRTGELHFNTDGSLHDVYFEPGDPLVVHGMTLWNTVSWSYAPGSFGQGRSRHAVTVTGAVSGTAPGQDGLEGTVTVRLSDGRVTPAD